MPAPPIDTTTTDSLQAVDATVESPVTLAVHRAFRVAVPLAALCVAIAIAVNWWTVARAGEALPGPVVAGVEATGVPAPESVELDKPAIDFLPGRVLQFETITLQAIPGMGNAAAEAVYKTLNMNTEAQISVVVYARAEGFSSDADAEARIKELMQPYTVERAEALVGQTPSIAGYTADKGSYAYGWTRGRYATYVKASFSDWIPAHSHDIAKRQAVAVAELVEFFQRTGKQGVQAK